MNFKHTVFLIAGMIFMPAFYAQNITDALRYSQDNIEGSARFRAMGGAFGALGGDLSAVNLNPAGSAIFNSTFLSVTLSSKNTKNDTSFYNRTYENSSSNTDFSQAGAAVVLYNNNLDSAFKKFSFAIAIDKAQDFDNQWTAHGINTNSIDRYFLTYAQGLRLDEISALSNESIPRAYSEIGRLYGSDNQQAFLGYESYIIEPFETTDENTVYTSNIAPGTFNQFYNYISTGYNGKIAYNFATQINERLYAGVNLNWHFINFEKYTYLSESNTNLGSAINRVEFENSLATMGNGFSFQIGTIYKVTDNLRLGATYNSPVWYAINEETTQAVTTNRTENGSIITQIINPGVVNVYPEYTLQTPGKLSGSIAYIFGTKGLISFDYAYKDFGNTKFKPTNTTYFSEQNGIIKNELKGVSSFAVGSEYRLKQLSLRGGYRFEESPYKNNETIGDLTGYSLGLGYTFGNTRFDFTYDQSQRNTANQLYNVGLTDTVLLDSKIANFIFSLSFTL